MTLAALFSFGRVTDVAFSGSFFVVLLARRSPLCRVRPDTSLITGEWVATRIAGSCEDSK
jgi:hypothetical protein